MTRPNAYFRVPVVIFAVLVGGLYVYAKSGGRFFSPGKPTPAVDSGENEPGVPRIEFMLGPKSAPAFLPETSPSAQVEQQPGTPAPRPTLLPGSKSDRVVAPESLAPAQPTNAADVAPNSPAPNSRLLPGSKSAILIDPSALQPVQPAPPPTANTERPRSLFPGSKSRAVVDPEAFRPAPSNAAPHQQPVQQQRTRNYAPQGVQR